MLSKQVGQVFAGVVVSVDEDKPTHGDIVVQEPAIEASVTSASPLPLGSDVEARLVEADVGTRRVRFEV